MRHGNVGVALVGVLGVSLLAGTLGYFAYHQYHLRGPLWLMAVALFIVTVLSGGLVYGSYSIAGEEFSPDMRWRATLWCLGGTVGALSMTFWSIFYQHAVGVTIGDPLFVLFVSGGIGANAGLLVGVYDVRLRRRQRELERARDGLRFLNRSLRHNVLNSINVIDGYADRLAEHCDSESASRYVGTIRERAERITTLVRNTRVLVRRIGDHRRIEPTCATHVLETEIERLRSVSPDAEITAELEDDVYVRGDELLASVFENVLTNVIEHAREGTPRLEISLTSKDGTATVRVADEGPGIPDDEKETVFEPGTYGDAGLGLYLVDALVTDYGGDVRLEDNDPQGTVVTIELPLENRG